LLCNHPLSPFTAHYLQASALHGHCIALRAAFRASTVPIMASRDELLTDKSHAKAFDLCLGRQTSTLKVFQSNIFEGGIDVTTNKFEPLLNKAKADLTVAEMKFRDAND